MGCREAAVHQTDYISPFSSAEKGKETGFCFYYKEYLESPLLRMVYICRRFSSTHGSKCRFFCHMAAGPCFLGKARAGLSSHLVKTILLAVVGLLGR